MALRRSFHVYSVERRLHNSDPAQRLDQSSHTGPTHTLVVPRKTWEGQVILRIAAERRRIVPTSSIKVDYFARRETVPTYFKFGWCILRYSEGPCGSSLSSRMFLVLGLKDVCLKLDICVQGNLNVSSSPGEGLDAISMELLGIEIVAARLRCKTRQRYMRRMHRNVLARQRWLVPNRR